MGNDLLQCGSEERGGERKEGPVIQGKQLFVIGAIVSANVQGKVKATSSELTIRSPSQAR